ncbi:MAG: mevalonate kinase, partial [Bradymonadaceae bacterium]
MTQRAVGIGCAKIILGGDYAVVYGQPAVASPIDRTVTVRIEGAEAWEIEVENEVAEKLVVSASLEQVCQQMSRAFGVETPFAVRIENAVPVGAGFGSSSAFNVAFARALAEWSGTGELVERVAEEAEEALHGYPSAIDLDASLRQGRFLYRGEEGDGAGPIESIAGPRLSLVAGWVGHGTPTERAYRDVETLRESEPELFERV